MIFWIAFCLLAIQLVRNRDGLHSLTLTRTVRIFSMLHGDVFPQLLVRHARTFTVDGLRASDDVASLLAAIERKCGVPPAAAWLSFEGRRFEAGRALGDYGLCAGATVHLATRGRGGGGRSSKPNRGRCSHDLIIHHRACTHRA